MLLDDPECGEISLSKEFKFSDLYSCQRGFRAS
jgi:hypothetical protein